MHVRQPKTAAARLGHHSAGFPLDCHIHALESLDEAAADRLQDILTAIRTRPSEPRVSRTMKRL
jgi:hypothetical protein